MDPVTYEAALNLSQSIIFSERSVNVADALILLNWLDDNKPVRINRHKNGFLTLCYCSRCSTIVQDGDRFCNGCGRKILND